MGSLEQGRRKLALIALSVGLSAAGVACSTSGDNDGTSAQTSVTVESPSTTPSEHAFKEQDRVVLDALIHTYINSNVNVEFWKKFQVSFSDTPENVAKYFTVSKKATKIDGHPDNVDQLSINYVHGADQVFIDLIAPRNPRESSLINIVLRSPDIDSTQSPFQNLPTGLEKAPVRTAKDGSRRREYNGGKSGVQAMLTSHRFPNIMYYDLLLQYGDEAARPALPSVAH